MQDPKTMMEEFTKMISGLKVPGVDMSALMESQRKNIAAMMEASKTAAGKGVEIAKRQGEMVQAAMSQAMTAMQEWKASADPKEFIAGQAEFMRKAFAAAIENARELTETAGKAADDQIEAMRRRMAASLREIKAAISKSEK